MNVFQINFEEKTTGEIIFILQYETGCYYNLNQVVYLNHKYYVILEIKKTTGNHIITVCVEKIKRG